ncbi:MAG: thpR [Alphaproteobacteria bacterium]|nr:thpR [Alphaproteobacteria bacterium]
MHRLFVAIRPPRAIRERLIGLMGGVSGARWLSDDQIHLTLRFIGEVDRHLASDVHAALGSIHHPAFEIALDGMHVFDRRGEPVTLWVGATPHESLRALHKKVDQACLLAGIAPDRRTFLPHITIARLGRGSGPITSALENSGGVTSERFTVRDFCLYESDLTPDGPIYTLVERYSLD